ncbi:hypothetical protein KAR91_65415 [Candidatus Pacearchaeota archaeon]|nr:hypothetical protein [Candidatus Pacearchaeota archaeon]
MKTFTKAQRKLNKYRGEMLDEAQEYTDMIVMAETARRATEAEAGRAVKGLKALANFFGD